MHGHLLMNKKVSRITFLSPIVVICTLYNKIERYFLIGSYFIPTYTIIPITLTSCSSTRFGICNSLSLLSIGSALSSWMMDSSTTSITFPMVVPDGGSMRLDVLVVSFSRNRFVDVAKESSGLRFWMMVDDVDERRWLMKWRFMLNSGQLLVASLIILRCFSFLFASHSGQVTNPMIFPPGPFSNLEVMDLVRLDTYSSSWLFCRLKIYRILNK